MRKVILTVGLMIGLVSFSYADPWNESGNYIWDGTNWIKQTGTSDLGDVGLNTGSNLIGQVNYASPPTVQPVGVLRQDVDSGLISAGSFTFVTGDNLSTEKLTGSIEIGPAYPHQDNVYLLAIEKDVTNGMADSLDRDLTITTYNDIKIDGTNTRNTTHSTHTVESNTAADVYRDYLVQGLFFGQGSIKIGVKYASNATIAGIGTPSTVWYRLYKF